MCWEAACAKPAIASAPLVEAETGKHVWAERYDRDLADIFAVQDEVTEAVTIAIAPARPIRTVPECPAATLRASGVIRVSYHATSVTGERARRMKS
jgi:adenylate cyclase